MSTVPSATDGTGTDRRYTKVPVTRFHEIVEQFRRTLIIETLRAHKGNRTAAARAIGLQRTYLLRLIREYGIDVPPQSRNGTRE